MTLVLGIVLAAAVVLIVALPFLREPTVEDDRLDARSADDLRRIGLAEDRDRALAALKDLEFDHRSGDIDDRDYRELVGPLRQAVASALRAIEQDRRYGLEVTDFETPDPPPEPSPPPDEGTPPTPAPVPEPYPPPDEATLPQE
jgi:hypothetical protein